METQIPLKVAFSSGKRKENQTEYEFSQYLERMLASKDKLCVSVIVPTHRLSPERRTDGLRIKQALGKAADHLRNSYGSRETEELITTMNELYTGIDYTHNKDGIGIFVSQDLSLLVRFPFPVEEKVTAGYSFEIRDLLYTLNYAGTYYVLLLNRKGARLFRAELDRLHEMDNEHFPLSYTDDYEYTKPARGSSNGGDASLKSFEKDKSVMQETRLRAFFNSVNSLLGEYINDDAPLLLCAVEKEIASFREISAYKKNIKGGIAGSYDHLEAAALAPLAWPLMRSGIDECKQELIRDFDEKFGLGLGMTDLGEIWRAAYEGRGHRLLVEKDYRIPGFLTKENYILHLVPPAEPHITVTDAVDKVIEKILETAAEVIIVENGSLEKYGRIALQMRY